MGEFSQKIFFSEKCPFRPLFLGIKSCFGADEFGRTFDRTFYHPKNIQKLTNRSKIDQISKKWTKMKNIRGGYYPKGALPRAGDPCSGSSPSGTLPESPRCWQRLWLLWLNCVKQAWRAPGPRPGKGTPRTCPKNDKYRVIPNLIKNDKKRGEKNRKKTKKQWPWKPGFYRN
jgi:hypothetical protein